MWRSSSLSAVLLILLDVAWILDKSQHSRWLMWSVWMACLCVGALTSHTMTGRIAVTPVWLLFYSVAFATAGSLWLKGKFGVIVSCSWFCSGLHAGSNLLISLDAADGLNVCWSVGLCIPAERTYNSPFYTWLSCQIGWYILMGSQVVESFIWRNKKLDSAVRAPVVNKVDSRRNKEVLRDVRKKWKNFLIEGRHKS